MTFEDLTKIPLTGTTLSLADAYRLVHYKTVFKLGYAEVDRHLSRFERRITLDVALWSLSLRGAGEHLWPGWCTDDPPEDEKEAPHHTLCPLTADNFCKSVYLLQHCNGGAETLDFLAIKMGWLPTDFWAAEREKEALTNMIFTELHIVGKMYENQGAIVPTLPQLLRLIIDTEDRLSRAITAASAVPDGTWTVDATFGSSTACRSFSAGDAASGAQGHAHEFQWLSFPTTREARCSIQALVLDWSQKHPSSQVHVSEVDRDAENIQYPVDLNVPMPTFVSLLSPAIAIAKFVFLGHQLRLDWRPDFRDTYWAASIYFCKLFVSVTSGKKFAETVATRPALADLPQLQGHVEVAVNFHANHERHNRAFPALASELNNDVVAAETPRAPNRRRVASETRDDEWQQPAGHEARCPNEAQRRRHEEILKAALKRYEASVNGLNQKLEAAFDDGKKVDLFTLLCDWPAVLDAVEDNEAKELGEGREAKASAHKILDEWVYEVCWPHT